MTEPERRAQRHGLTLIEVMVALLVTSIIAVTANALVISLRHATALERVATVTHDQRMAADRHLRALVARAYIRDSTTRFLGSDEGFALSTFCEAPGGWLEECRVMADVTLSPTPAITFRTPHAGAAVITFKERPRLSYLGRDGSWAGAWQSETTLPVAIAVESAARLLVLRIGERG